jgi:phage terminase large subunit-like protein
MSPEAHFRIFRLGQWVDGVECWLGDDGRRLWDSLIAPYVPVLGAPTWLGVDVALKRDSTALVAVQRRPDERLHAWSRVWTPTADRAVDVTDVMQAVRDMASRFAVQAVSYDPRFFDVPAKMLADEGLPMVEIPQSVERMSAACGKAYELVRNGGLTHDGDQTFTIHVLNAVARFNERGFMLAKSKSRGHIDAAVALVLAVERATAHSPLTDFAFLDPDDFLTDEEP